MIVSFKLYRPNDHDLAAFVRLLTDNNYSIKFERKGTKNLMARVEVSDSTTQCDDCSKNCDESDVENSEAEPLALNFSKSLSYNVLDGSLNNLRKTGRWVGVVNCDSLNVRTWAGVDNELCEFSPLSKGDEIGICDSIVDKDNRLWYYIKYLDNYGFVCSGCNGYDWVKKKVCNRCNRTDGFIYTSSPSQIRCKVSGHYHYCSSDCDVDYDTLCKFDSDELEKMLAESKMSISDSSSPISGTITVSNNSVDINDKTHLLRDE